MEHSRHVFRALLVLLVAIAAIVLGRSLLVPRSYGAYGPYRYDNVAEQRASPRPLHGGAASCGECHGDRLAALRAGAHRTVSCEVCHAPLGRHVRDGALVAAMPVDRTTGLCARCHARLEGRPASFPQIAVGQHADGAAAAGCLECHDPHSPKP